MDDKHRCKVGEPGLPVAAVERGKQVVVSTSGNKFAVADHDLTKFAIIPSVVVMCDMMRTRKEERFESAIARCNSISQVREAVKTTVDLKEALQESMEPLKVLIHSIFSRLSLKDNPTMGYSAATENEMEAIF